MKALTIWQPWASLIVAGAKPYEFRGWRLPASLIGQRIVIHAATRKIDQAEAWCLYHTILDRDLDEESAREAAKTCLIPEKALPILRGSWVPGNLPIAAGLGTAILGEPRNGLEIAEEFGVPFGNWLTEHANWGWPMLEIERWAEPIPMRGKQGFWNWPEPVEILGELA